LLLVAGKYSKEAQESQHAAPHVFLAKGSRRDWLSPFVMPGLVPGIHVFGADGKKGVDGRVT
jgi:hypothetical protein